MTIAKDGSSILTLEDWCRFAPPKRDNQWVPGRSAMEAARSWLALTSPAFPSEVAAALASHPAFGTITSWNAEPEAHLPFDAFRGPRQTDLLVRARDEHGDFLIAVDAKADEPFGETVAEAEAAAAERKRTNPHSRGVERIERLTLALFGSRLDEDASLGELRYQLLTATAGAVAEAVRNGGQRVVLLVQEFRTRRPEMRSTSAINRTWMRSCAVYRMAWFRQSAPELCAGQSRYRNAPCSMRVARSSSEK